MLLKSLKYAAYCAALTVCLYWLDGKLKKCFEKPDDWSIDSEIHGTETAAGYLRKKGKGATGSWSKRYVVLDKNKLIYYADQMRDNVKGEIVIAGATAQESTTQADTEDQFYFEISHPSCGTREFYTKSNNRRRQWIYRINALSAQLISTAHFGDLLKLNKGSFMGPSWQKRWSVCVTESLDYFESATANQAKGSLFLRDALVREVNDVEGQEFCIEVEQSTSAGMFSSQTKSKVYTFAVENQFERDKWLEVLKSAAAWYSFNNDDGEGNGNTSGGFGGVFNPLVDMMGFGSSHHNEEEGEEGEEGEDSKEAGGSMNRANNSTNDRFKNLPLKEGFLEKKSTSSFSLSTWQSRWFAIDVDKGHLVYYGSDPSKEEGVERKGEIPLSTVIDENVNKIDGCTFSFQVEKSNRIYELKAANGTECEEWIKVLDTWIYTLA